jgi:hypothetical protein
LSAKVAGKQSIEQISLLRKYYPDITEILPDENIAVSKFSFIFAVA